MTELVTSSPETSVTDDDDDGAENAPKTRKNAAVKQQIGTLTAESVLEPQQTHARAEKFLQRILGEKTKKADSEESTSTKAVPEAGSRPVAEREDVHQEQAPDEFSTAEQHEIAQQYAAADKAALQAVAAAELEQSKAISSETAQQLAFIDKLQQKLVAEPEVSVEAAANAAEAEVIEALKADMPESELTGQPDGPAPDAETVTPTDEDEETPATTGGHTAAGGGAGSGSGAGSGHAGGSGGSAGTSGGPAGSGGPGAGAGFNNYYGPPSPGYGAYTAAVNAANTMPGNYINVIDARSNERTAIAQGLLIGGIVGYILGKRRGRIKTEKKLAPIRQKLEKQVRDMTGMIAEKQRNISLVTAERDALLRSRAAASRPEVTRSSAAEVSQRRPERLGRVLVEAPALAAAVRSEQAAATTRNRPPVVPFTKKVESFTDGELNRAAEKVLIDGVSLKEMRDAKRINEPGLRRVMAEFLQGGNVREALNRELDTTDLAYERDPKLRQAVASQQAAQAAGAGASASAGSTAAGGAGSTGPASTPALLDLAALKHPVPSQAMLKAVRKQQIMSVAAVTVVVGIAIAVVVLLIG